MSRAAIEAAAAIYARAERVIAVYGMGLTQHRAGVEAVQMLVNLLLLRGNIGNREPVFARSAAIQTFRASAPSVSRKSRNWFRWIALLGSLASSLHVRRE